MEGWGRRRLFTPPGQPTLALVLFREGKLDVCLSGQLVTGAKGQPLTMTIDKDGYWRVTLFKEVQRGEGGHMLRVREKGRKERIRYAKRQTAMVSRLVLMKALAVERHGDQWREHLTDLPRGLDVDHIDYNRNNNRRDNLRLETERTNRARKYMSEEEEQQIADSVNACYTHSDEPIF